MRIEQRGDSLKGMRGRRRIAAATLFVAALVLPGASAWAQQACEDSPYPTCMVSCAGNCFPDETALRCACGFVWCLSDAPVRAVTWKEDKVTLAWWGLCPPASSYNVYRIMATVLPDANHDGVADDYGTCFRSGLTTPEAFDGSRPALGQVLFYQVTAKFGTLEGPMGNASNGSPRQNVGPCP